MTSSVGSSLFPNFMPTALPPQPPQNGPTLPPPSGADKALDILQRTGFEFSTDPNSPTQTQWIDAARVSANPATRAQYQAFVLLAGGRTDNAAIGQAMDNYHAIKTAETASDIAGAVKNYAGQLATALDMWDPINIAANAAQPAMAQMGREAGLERTAWGAHLQKILDTPGTIASFRSGFRDGILGGASAALEGMASIAKVVADHSPIGLVGDAIRKVTGPLPGALDTLPSLQRGLQTDKKILDVGQKIGTYLAHKSPAEVRADAVNFISRNWEGLKASHAAAAKQGPMAEARWWGQAMGRATFEAAMTFIPVTKAGTAAKIGDVAADGLRLADKGVDGARAARNIENEVRATDQVSNTAITISRYIKYYGDGPLFRGDKRPPSEIFRTGFEPKGGTDNLRDYVEGWEDSIFVSTSKAQDVASSPLFSGGPGGYVYEIDATMLKGKGIDVNKSLGKHIMENELEVAFPGGVPREAITGAREVLPNGSLGDLVNNPFYEAK